MCRRPFLLVAVALALVTALGCSDADAPADDATADPDTTTTSAATETSDTTVAVEEPTGTAFTWVTTMDVDGSGYVLTVDGELGDDHATYTMQVDVILADGVEPSIESNTAGAAVNGVIERGAPLEESDPDGATEVVVDGTDRWYRSPWLLGEAADAMAGADWVHVVNVVVEPRFLADISRWVLTERYDEAPRMLLDLVEAGDRIQAPRADPDSDLDRLLSPWLGLAGPDAPDGSPAIVSGDRAEGVVSWDQALPNGRLAGEVTWEPTDAEPPDPPDPDDVIELDQLAEQFSQAG